MLLVMTSPFSFIILIISFLSLCFWISLASGLPIVWILSKNQLLVLLMCSTVLLVSNSLIAALILINCFLVRGLGLFFCSSSSFLRWEYKNYILDFCIFLSEAWMAMYLPLNTTFAVSHRFWTHVFSFSLVSKNCLNWFLISWFTQSFLSGMVLSCQVFGFLQIFPCEWVPISECCGLKICRE